MGGSRLSAVGVGTFLGLSNGVALVHRGGHSAGGGARGQAPARGQERAVCVLGHDLDGLKRTRPVCTSRKSCHLVSEGHNGEVSHT